MTGLNSLIQPKDLEQEKTVNFFFADLYIIETRFYTLDKPSHLYNWQSCLVKQLMDSIIPKVLVMTISDYPSFMCSSKAKSWHTYELVIIRHSGFTS